MNKKVVQNQNDIYSLIAFTDIFDPNLYMTAEYIIDTFSTINFVQSNYYTNSYIDNNFYNKTEIDNTT